MTSTLKLMAALAVVFLLQAIMFSTGFMLPCFLMTLCYFWFSYASKREYEYTLDENSLKIERVSDRGRRICSPSARRRTAGSKPGCTGRKRRFPCRWWWFSTATGIPRTC